MTAILSLIRHLRRVEEIEQRAVFRQQIFQRQELFVGFFKEILLLDRHEQRVTVLMGDFGSKHRLRPSPRSAIYRSISSRCFFSSSLSRITFSAAVMVMVDHLVAKFDARLGDLALQVGFGLGMNLLDLMLSLRFDIGRDLLPFLDRLDDLGAALVIDLLQLGLIRGLLFGDLGLLASIRLNSSMMRVAPLFHQIHQRTPGEFLEDPERDQEADRMRQ